MNKPFYSNCILHFMRFYSRYPDTTHFKSEADKQNWYACKKALESYSDKDKQILMQVYAGRDTLADNVYETAIAFKTNVDYIWDMLPDFERAVAKKRGLI